jgi:hypothetical protein
MVFCLPPNFSFFDHVPVSLGIRTYIDEVAHSYDVLVNSRAPGNPARRFAFIQGGNLTCFVFFLGLW